MSIRSAHDLLSAQKSRRWREPDNELPQWRRSGLRGLQITFAVLKDITEGQLLQQTPVFANCWNQGSFR
jgi:hypothetical protein